MDRRTADKKLAELRDRLPEEQMNHMALIDIVRGIYDPAPDDYYEQSSVAELRAVASELPADVRSQVLEILDDVRD